MNWTSCLRSRPFKYGALFGGLALGVGTGVSAALSLKLASLCSSAVHSFISDIGTSITISELSGVVHFNGLNVTITLADITAALPEGWLELLNQATNLTPYCFSIPFSTGICITSALAFGLAGAVALAVHMRDTAGEENSERAIPDLELTEALLNPR